MTPSLPRYMDANVAYYIKCKDRFRAKVRRPSKYVKSDGTWIPLKKVNWNIPWHIVEMTMDETTIEELNNDLTKSTHWRTGRVVGGFTKGSKWRRTIKKARKDFLDILLEKQASGSLLCITNAKVWGMCPGNLIEIIQEGNKYYIVPMGETKKRRYALSMKEIEGISWIED